MTPRAGYAGTISPRGQMYTFPLPKRLVALRGIDWDRGRSRPHSFLARRPKAAAVPVYLQTV